MKPFITILVSVLFTLGLGYQKITTSDWSAGNGQTPREMMADYFALAYDEGKGAQAAQEYHGEGFVDHAASSAELTDGEPIEHDIHNLVSEGMNFSVHHTIQPGRGQAGGEFVDIYRIERGHIVERWRVGASEVTSSETESVPSAPEA